jgi:sugar/nucleoside kinase (ribokinase family)
LKPPNAEALWQPSAVVQPIDVVGLGQCALDEVALVEARPEFTGKQRIVELSHLPGGQIATALLACSRLGLRTALLSAVGDDPAADVILEPLRTAGVDLAGVRVVSGARSQLSVIIVDQESGERTVLWHRDSRLSVKFREGRREEIEQGRVLHVDAQDVDLSIWAAGVAREAGIPVVLDADTPGPGLDALLRRVDFPIVSREFAEKYFGSEDPREGLKGLAALGARFAVVTMGDRGAMGKGGAGVIESPAFQVTARDTTGAGDVFHAAFIFGLLEGMSAARILRVANAAAAMNCRALGAQGALDFGVTGLILLVMVLLGAAGEHNYQRNLAAEEQKAPRRYQGYSDVEIVQLIGAYQREVEALEARFGETRRRNQIETRSGGLIDEQIGEFERAQQASSSTRAAGADVAQKAAILRELQRERSLRSDGLDSLKIHLRRMFTI